MSDDDSPYYTEAELALIRRHKIAAQKKARAAVEARGVTVHPRLAIRAIDPATLGKEG